MNTEKKIDLVETYDLNGTWYYIDVDGVYQSNTMTQNKEQAEKYYDLYIKAKGTFKTKTILKSAKV